MKLEIVSMLTVSMAHVSKETYDRLLEDGTCNDLALSVYEKAVPQDRDESFGVYIYLDSVAPGEKRLPEDLRALVDFALEHNCGVLCLDGDGPELEGFVLYEW